MATVCVIDHTTAGGDILQANRKCAYYMGWDKETLCGRPLEVLAHEAFHTHCHLHSHVTFVPTLSSNSITHKRQKQLLISEPPVHFAC